MQPGGLHFRLFKIVVDNRAILEIFNRLPRWFMLISGLFSIHGNISHSNSAMILDKDTGKGI